MGVDFLVNMTNDAWYGRESWHGRTTALWQHPAHSILRAIELRIGVARAANTGISLFVDPLGRAFERTEISVPDVRVTTVYTTDTTTLYARLGDWETETTRTPEGNHALRTPGRLARHGGDRRRSPPSRRRAVGRPPSLHGRVKRLKRSRGGMKSGGSWPRERDTADVAAQR